jgi:transcriptional regulator with XRE-family HTH domain
MTQAQLAASISRTGKYISEVETGRTRLSEPEVAKLATVLGVSPNSLVEADANALEQQVEELPRRIRESQPTGLMLFSFPQLIEHLDRSGWLRQCKLWSVSAEPFPEENDVALVEQLGELAASKGVRLRYVYSAQRLKTSPPESLPAVQGTREALPAALVSALGWSAKLREQMEQMPDAVTAYVLGEEFPFFSPLQSYLWVETAGTSWSDVMPLLYGRSETRTHENSNASVPFWYHLPRDRGSRMLISLAQCVKMIDRRPVGA